MKKKHPSGKTDQFECDFDGKIFKTKKELYCHMRCHLSLVECQICHKMQKYPYIHYHMKTVHAADKKFRCKVCEKQFKSTQVLSIHEKNHNKKYKCDLCKKMFSVNATLNQHKKHYHENPRSFECEICGKKFNQRSSLKNHQEVHDKNRPKSIQCQRCDYATNNMNYLKVHQKSHVRQDKRFASMKNPLKCEKCPKFLKDKAILKLHMRRVHPKELLQCDLCAIFIKSKHSLIKHINNHIRKNASN
ncbi:zinc finger protein 25-like [Chironomus tepperi]|uniref:zinc finger protein 25-like n=1 Tax=Chironomus tepperi TaxID=113505 RepID=UPI00391FA3C6